MDLGLYHIQYFWLNGFDKVKILSPKGKRVEQLRNCGLDSQEIKKTTGFVEFYSDNSVSGSSEFGIDLVFADAKAKFSSSNGFKLSYGKTSQSLELNILKRAGRKYHLKILNINGEKFTIVKSVKCDPATNANLGVEFISLFNEKISKNPIVFKYSKNVMSELAEGQDHIYSINEKNWPTKFDIFTIDYYIEQKIYNGLDAYDAFIFDGFDIELCHSIIPSYLKTLIFDYSSTKVNSL